jgi:hypothetical protein
VSATDPHSALIVDCDLRFATKILAWKNVSIEWVSNIFKAQSFDQHNWLVDVNSIFSSAPAGILFDRTCSTTSPFKLKIHRPWKIPKSTNTLAEAMQQRVHNLLCSQKTINLFWSGGIDSTAMVAAFLQHASCRKQLRIFYTPFSCYEHAEFFDLLKKFDDLELVDLSGTAYMTQQFDGLFVTGDGGDELMASLDESFFLRHGRDLLDTAWKDFFYQTQANDQFIDFCQAYFSQSGREIHTVLQARWFFYAMCKTRFQLSGKLDLFAHYDQFHPDQLLGFFDCDEYENYIYWNLDDIIPGTQYHNWKQPLKQYCFDFDGLDNYYRTKQKQGSGQTHMYAAKNKVLHDRRSIFLLSDGTRVTTPSLPLFSRREWETKYGNTLDYLFNEPN